MSSKFRKGLKGLMQDVLEMGYLAREMLENAVKSLQYQNGPFAEYTNSKKEMLADIDDKIEQKALQLIALHHPVAGDLRIITASLKIITSLARIGRYGKDIANISLELLAEYHFEKLVNIPHMAQIVYKMIDEVLEAYKSGDISPFEDFIERDDDVDALRYSIFRECITYMIEDPKKITVCTNYIMVARYLERCADHACDIAEKVQYIYTGERVEFN